MTDSSSPREVLRSELIDRLQTDFTGGAVSEVLDGDGNVAEVRQAAALQMIRNGQAHFMLVSGQGRTGDEVSNLYHLFRLRDEEFGRRVGAYISDSYIDYPAQAV